MNQILDYNPNKSSGGGSSGSDKVVRVFALLLACFAICLLVGGGIGLYKNKQKTNVEVEAPTQAKITVKQEDTKIIINVSHDKAIEKLIYSWDSEKETSVKGTGESTLTAEVPVIAGTHTLNIKVIDIEQVETTHEQEFTSDVGEDKLYPVISLEVTEQKKLKITATDETAIDFVTYRWNDEEEVRINAEQEIQQQIITEIEIKKGENNLTIIAVDKANNTSNKQQTFTGLMQPNIKVVLSEDKSKLIVTCSHENGISKIEYTLNDKPYAGEFDNLAEVQFEQLLDEGYNKIIITATSSDGTTTTFGGECTYTPQNTVTIQ